MFLRYFIHLHLPSSHPLAHKALLRWCFIIVSLVSVIDRFFQVWGIGSEPTSLRGLDGLILEWPSPGRFCLKRLNEHRLPRFWIRVFLLLRYSRSAVPYSVIFGTISHAGSPREILPPSATQRTRPYIRRCTPARGDRLPMTSYQYSIITMGLSCTVSKK